MSPFPHFLSSPYLWLLPLGIVAYHALQVSRQPPAVFAVVGPLVTLLTWGRRAAARLETQPLGQPQAVPALFLNVAEAQRAFYHQAKSLTPGLVEYLRWFHTLPADSRPTARLAGPGGVWTDHRFRHSFRLFVLNYRGYCYVDFMAAHLNTDQFVRWVSLLQLAAPDDAALATVLRQKCPAS